MAKTTTYLCENPACSLGAVGYPGRFTRGIHPAALNLLTGQPVEEIMAGKYGANETMDGICPNCGKPGKKED